MATSPLFRLLAIPSVPLGSLLFEGFTAVRGESPFADVPPMRPTLRSVGEAVVDRSFTVALNLLAGVPGPSELRRARAESVAARNLVRKRGWMRNPRSFHRTPPPIDEWEEETSRWIIGFGARQVEYRELFWNSGFEPHAELPGAQRWGDHEENRTAHAIVLEHEGAPRPWVVAVHGFGMGTAFANFPGLYAQQLHEELGLNVIFPTLPMHGPRAVGSVSGAGLLEPGDMTAILHAFAQATWDIRRAIGWVRDRAQGEPIALYGLSLGGYMSGLVSALEDGLACVIAGVPPTDFPNVARENQPVLHRAVDPALQPDWQVVRELTWPVSPLAFDPLVPREQRSIYAGIVDRVVRPTQARALWRHWDRPEVHWYSGGHVLGQFNRGVYEFVRAALRRGGLTTSSRRRDDAASTSSRKAASRSAQKAPRSGMRS